MAELYKLRKFSNKTVVVSVKELYSVCPPFINFRKSTYVCVFTFSQKNIADIRVRKYKIKKGLVYLPNHLQG